jgi:hypothetical protein
VALAEQAFTEGRWADVLTLLEEWIAEEARAATLWQEARTQLIGDLYARADQAEQSGDWDGALDALHRLQALSVPDETLPSRLERATWEREAVLALDRARKALTHKKWKAVIAETQGVLARFPDRAEVLALRHEAEQAWAVQRARQRRWLFIGGGTGLLLLLVGLITFLWNRGGLPGSPSRTSGMTPTMAT